MANSPTKGNISKIFEQGIFVKFTPEWSPEPQEGLIHWEDIPGCQSPSDLPDICKVGDSIMVDLSERTNPNDVILDCIKFPVS